MGKIRSRGRDWKASLLILAAIALATGVPAQARVRHSESWARDHFANAERMREALNGRPRADRTRHDYQRVLNAYRLVYMGAPASAKADPSVVAVAETLVEMGRRFDDDKILHAAISEYKFLRREYPGSRYRFDGLFTIGEVYKDDLNDPEAARSAFQEFLRRYPHNRLAADAHDAIAELDKQARAEKAETAKGSGKKQPVTSRGTIASNEKDDDDAPTPSATDTKRESVQLRSGHFPRVTAIRHWSTPDYTRVAVDVEGDVQFSSQRIDSPSRIYFDLRDTRLASTLVGKSFDVDDGFLKKIRLAQYAPGRTRVVLEVDNLSKYNAFLLPNPYRLIIDIHGDDRDSARKIALPDLNSAAKRPNPAENSAVEDSDGSAVANSATTQGTPVDAENAEADKPSESDVPKAAVRVKVAATNDDPVVVKRVVEADDDAPVAASTRTKHNLPLPAPARGAASNRPHGNEKLATDDPEDSNGPDDALVAHREASARSLAAADSGDKADFSGREARPMASGDRTLIRTLGLKIGKIVIDAGHGGHDTGTIGPNGLEEKNLVLDVARRLGKLLEGRLGAEVVYTRKDDTFIPLETRTAIANQARADLFVSIHANSSHDSAARGVETYYLNFTSSPEALEVAARENAVSEKSIFELQDLVKKIALKEKIEESREFAGDVEESLHSGLASKAPAIRDRGVKKAPFIVLIGANMPSILAEISFVSNPTDEHHLETAEYRERIAESLYHGIARYANGLSGVKVASKMDKGAGQ